MNNRCGPITELGLRNVRSFSDLAIELDPGLNVIVGPSDAGKSNIARSIRSVAENDSAATIAKAGFGNKGSISAALTFGGEAVELRKEPAYGKNDYIHILDVGSKTVGQHTYTSVGSGVPPQLVDVLNMGQVQLAGELVSLNFAPQRGPALGVDDSPARLARIIGAVSGLDVIFKAVRRGEKQRREAAGLVKAHRAAFEEARDRYRGMKAALDITAAQQDYEACSSMLSAAQKEVARAADLTAAIAEVQREAAAARAAKARVDALGGALHSATATLEEARTAVAISSALDEALEAFEYSRQEVLGLKGACEAAGAEVAEAGNLLRRFSASVKACPLCGKGANVCRD